MYYMSPNLSIDMENLRKDYPNMFRRKEVLVTTKPPHKIKWHDNVPIIDVYETHIEVRKLKDSSPMILNKDYTL